MIAKDRRLLLLAIYAAVSAAAMIHLGRPDTALGIVLYLLLFIWVCAPVALFCAWKDRNLATAIGLVIVAAVGLYLYIDVAWIPPGDALDGLVFAFLPAYQLAFALVWLAGIWLLKKIGKRDGVDEADL